MSITFIERQTLALEEEATLSSVVQLTLDKPCFAECLTWILGKIYFYSFLFSNQTFCGVFLQYVGLHVQFWHNYKSVCYSYLV
jgi:hypothetical protein